jgi:hypothetical protein
MAPFDSYSSLALPKSAASVPVHQMRYVGLCSPQNAGDFALFQLLLFQDFEDLKSYLRTSHEVISVL